MGFSNADLGRVHPSNPSGAQPFLLGGGGGGLNTKALFLRGSTGVGELWLLSITRAGS